MLNRLASTLGVCALCLCTGATEASADDAASDAEALDTAADDSSALADTTASEPAMDAAARDSGPARDAVMTDGDAADEVDIPRIGATYPSPCLCALSTPPGASSPPCTAALAVLCALIWRRRR